MKTALITGATSGIGLETAIYLGEKGYKIIINGIVKEQAEEAAKLLVEKGIEVDFYIADVTNETEVNKMFADIAQKHDKLDVLINNAGGLGGRQRFEEMETSFFKKVMALNYDSVIYVTRAAIPLLKKAEESSVINYGSIATYNGGGPGAGIYAASKAAVTTLTRAMAKDLIEYGIRVNAVSPGTIDTPFHSATKREIVESWKESIVMKRLGNPKEVASVIGFLISEEASYLTGEIIQINGGQAFI